MTEQEISNKIALVQNLLAKATHVEDLKNLNRILERLIMLEPTQPKPAKKVTR